MSKKIYTFSNKYMFSSVMRNPNICRKVLERILDKKIDRIEFPEYEKTVDPQKIDAKGIRVDIYCSEEDSVYTVEMQNDDEDALQKRCRYYQSLMDIDNLEKGQHYDELRSGFVIFICRWDPYGEGRHIYTFENRCIQDTDLPFGDETRKIILNTKGTMDDPLLEEIDKEVALTNSNEKWRHDVMTYEQEIRDAAYFAEKRTRYEVTKEYEDKLSASESKVQDAEAKAQDAKIKITKMAATMIQSGIDKETIISISGISEEEYLSLIQNQD